MSWKDIVAVLGGLLAAVVVFFSIFGTKWVIEPEKTAASPQASEHAAPPIAGLQPISAAPATSDAELSTAALVAQSSPVHGVKYPGGSQETPIAPLANKKASAQVVDARRSPRPVHSRRPSYRSSPSALKTAPKAAKSESAVAAETPASTPGPAPAKDTSPAAADELNQFLQGDQKP
jgi:hypothetical protein